MLLLKRKKGDFWFLWVLDLCSQQCQIPNFLSCTMHSTFWGLFIDLQVVRPPFNLSSPSVLQRHSRETPALGENAELPVFVWSFLLMKYFSTSLWGFVHMTLLLRSWWLKTKMLSWEKNKHRAADLKSKYSDAIFAAQGEKKTSLRWEDRMRKNEARDQPQQWRNKMRWSRYFYCHIKSWN